MALKKKKGNNLIEGMLWNYGSIVILSLSGFLFNIIIMMFYDAAALGLFNRIHAWYVVLSQLSVIGIHMSSTKYSAEYATDRDQVKKILINALIPTLGNALLFGVISNLILWLLHMPTDNTIIGIKTLLPALVFFSLNKVILGCLNGLSEMKIYAVMQSLRYILIAAGIIILAVLNVPSVYLTYCFLIAEEILFVLLMIQLIKDKLLAFCIDREWIRKHLAFGLRIFPSNLVLEINTRVDIFCLSFILQDDYMIGIYSFAALFVEGFYQIFIVVRRSINPMLTATFTEGKLEEYVTGMKDKFKKTILILAVIAEVAIIVGFIILVYLIGKAEYLLGVIPMSIMLTAITISCISIILGNILSQTGSPTKESIINIMTVSCNCILNIGCIYLWGITGAAIATACSYMLFSFLLQKTAWKERKVRW